jgi:hypothetical protein
VPDFTFHSFILAVLLLRYLYLLLVLSVVSEGLDVAQRARKQIVHAESLLILYNRIIGQNRGNNYFVALPQIDIPWGASTN